MLDLLPTATDGARALAAIHWSCVVLRNQCCGGLALAEVVRITREDDARLNELLSGRLSGEEFARSFEAAAGRQVPSYEWLWKSPSWIDREYRPPVAVAFAHATRAFLKAVTWEGEAEAEVRRLATYFDAFEYIPLELMRRGPEWALQEIVGYADTLPPFVSASAVFQAFLVPPPNQRRA
jgi:hypothetical protein